MCDASVIIISYNTRELTLGCLRSVCDDRADSSVEIIVVDNASTDGTAAAIGREFPSVRLVQNPENVGFARANNQAMRLAAGEFWVLLNSDTLVLPGALREILKAFRDTGAAVVGPLLLNADRSIQPSHGRFASVCTEFLFQSFLYKVVPTPFVLGSTIHRAQRRAYLRPHAVDWVTGACLAIRAEVARAIGLLDESLFMYGEDMEWCWRVQRAGHQAWHWPSAQVIHLSGRSSQKDFARWIGNYTTGALRFALGHLAPIHARVFAAAIVLGSVVRRVLWTGVRWFGLRDVHECRSRIQGYRQACSLGCRALLEGRL